MTRTSTSCTTVWALETEKAAEPLGIGKVDFVFLRFHQFYFQFLALKTATFQRTKELLVERLDSNNHAGLNKHRTGWSASKINNRTDPN